MSYTVVVNTAQADALLNTFVNTAENLSDGLLQAVEDAFIPEVQSLSESLWGVRTGQYAGSWVPSAVGSNAVTVTNMAESLSDGYPYSLSLEYGWRNRAGGYVAQQAVDGTTTAIAEALLEWAMGQIA